MVQYKGGMLRVELLSGEVKFKDWSARVEHWSGVVKCKDWNVGEERYTAVVKLELSQDSVAHLNESDFANKTKIICMHKKRRQTSLDFDEAKWVEITGSWNMSLQPTSIVNQIVFKIHMYWTK